MNSKQKLVRDRAIRELLYGLFNRIALICIFTVFAFLAIALILWLANVR